MASVFPAALTLALPALNAIQPWTHAQTARRKLSLKRAKRGQNVLGQVVRVFESH